MTLPAPNLDDRHFQELVDEAKRYVSQRCPQWSDHNVSDPGVTLIETFALLVDQLIYRLNRVPDRLYVKFLELLGLQLLPPAAARAELTFRLAAAQPEAVTIPAATAVATTTASVDEAVVFTVIDDYDIVPCSLDRVASRGPGQEAVDHTDRLGLDDLLAFTPSPQPGDELLVGLSDPVPGGLVALTLDCRVEGHGVDPTRPPIVWEAWTNGGWRRCELEADTTGALNQNGTIELHLPADHARSSIAGRSAGWLRCRVIDPDDDRPRYRDSPRIQGIVAATVGGTTTAEHARPAGEEVLGHAEGVPGQRFQLRHRPVVSSGQEVLEVVTDGSAETWVRVDTFADHDEDELIFVLDHVAGEVILPPAVRQPDGALRRYGAVPPVGATVRIRGYRTGGGRRGNVEADRLTVLKSSIPFVTRVWNRRPATGGVDAEDLESAKQRGEITLRTNTRAVTAHDYEELARQAAPEAARVRCVRDDDEPNGLRVLVVPAMGDPDRPIQLVQVAPSEDTAARITAFLDERRMIGTRVAVQPCRYQGVTVDARLRARPGVDVDGLREAAIAATYRYLHPVRGGPDGDGWPFGRAVRVGEIHGVIQRVPGVDVVEELRLLPADPISGEPEQDAVDVIDLDRGALVFSCNHDIRVDPPRNEP